MANRYIVAMLPTLPGPVEAPLEAVAPEILTEYLDALDLLGRTPGPLGEAARERADAIRPAVEHERTRPRLPRVPPRPRDV